MEQPDIPIANLYYLLCYAWDKLEQAALIDISASPTTRLVDLFASVLTSGIKHLARRGLEQGYVSRRQEMSTVRGRLDIIATESRLLSAQGRVVCEADEMTANTLNNQIIKGTLTLMLACDELDPKLQSQVQRVHRALHGIDSIVVTRQSFRLVQLHANTRFYRFLLNVCELAHECALPDQTAGRVRFRDYLRDERAMAKLFERFLFNFVRRELPEVSVKRDRISWHARSEHDPELANLPTMNTDISVYANGVRLIIDAKYYRRAYADRFGSEKFHSAHLYQLLSYVSNARRSTADTVSGMLIYPRVDKTLNAQYEIQGHSISIATVDLSLSPPQIRDNLRALVQHAIAAEAEPNLAVTPTS